MRQNLKFLVFSILIVLTFVSPQKIHGMEEKTQENILPKIQLFQLIPEENINLGILKHAAAASLNDDTIGKLSVVCQNWRSIIKYYKIEVFKFAICQVYPVDPETCERFLNGRLIYKPNEDNDIGRLELRISDLANPLEGTFDLSQCDDAGQYLSISTGYKKGKKAENKDKVEIWFASWFLIEKELDTTAKHFQAIFANWDKSVEVGIFWTWGGWDNLEWYDDLITQNMADLSNDNLYEIWADVEERSSAVWGCACACGVRYLQKNFLYLNDGINNDPSDVSDVCVQ